MAKTRIDLTIDAKEIKKFRKYVTRLGMSVSGAVELIIRCANDPKCLDELKAVVDAVDVFHKKAKP